MHLKDGELRSTIRTYYGARTAMLMLFQGILFGLALGVALFRKAWTMDGSGRVALFAAAAAVPVLLPAFTTLVGARLVHRFSKSCRRKPLQAMEVRVVRRGQNFG